MHLMPLKKGEIPHTPMAKTIPMKLVDVQEGYVVYEITPDEEHINLQGGVHGGFCATVLDSVTGSVAHSLMEKGNRFATVDLNIKMIRPMQVGKTYRSIGHLINAGRTIVITEGKIVEANNKIYTHGSATLMLIRK